MAQDERQEALRRDWEHLHKIAIRPPAEVEAAPLTELRKTARDLGLSVEYWPATTEAPGEYCVRIWGRERAEWLWEDVGVKAALAYLAGYAEGLQADRAEAKPLPDEEHWECAHCGATMVREWACPDCKIPHEDEDPNNGDEGECDQCGDIVSYRYPVDGEWVCSTCRDGAAEDDDGSRGGLDEGQRAERRQLGTGD